jgi:ribose transport system ATP-binding protein
MHTHGLVSGIQWRLEMSVLVTNEISKIYPGTTALDKVSVSFESGKVHALMGKNGSGKSTLVKIFSGAIHPTEGDIILDGQLIKFEDPADAFKKGIATVYQELSLIPGLSVAENLFMGRLPMKGRLVDWKKTHKMAEDLLKEFKIDISTEELISNLSMWQCQMIEIVRAMSFNPKILLLDEATSALARNETQFLFKIVKELKNRDIIIIFVTHRIQEIWEIADDCTVLRDGRFIGNISMDKATPADIIHMMFGDIEIKSRPSDLIFSKEVVLKINQLTRKPFFEKVSFELRHGEILGIAGMLGAGRTELLEAIFGAEQFDSGEIIINGKAITHPNIEKMKNEGLAMIPEDRKNLGVIHTMSVRDNLCTASLDQIARKTIISKSVEREFALKQVENLQIKVADISESIDALSGGNQQKVVVGKWLNTNPQIILFDEPTRGIDVNAKQQIFKTMWELSRKGISSIFISSELEELLEVCHRILIMHLGKIVGEVASEEVKLDCLYSLCMGE